MGVLPSPRQIGQRFDGFSGFGTIPSNICFILPPEIIEGQVVLMTTTAADRDAKDTWFYVISHKILSRIAHSVEMPSRLSMIRRKLMMSRVRLLRKRNSECVSGSGSNTSCLNSLAEIAIYAVLQVPPTIIGLPASLTAKRTHVPYPNPPLTSRAMPY